MKITDHELSGVKIIEPKVFHDDRGFFMESFQSRRYQTICSNKLFIQDNISRSKRGVIRGLHYQLKHPQGKLVTVIRGEVFDAFVDIRRGSPTFGKWGGVILNDQCHQQLYIPSGFAHGFYALSDIADFYYKCTDYYYPEDEYGIAWNDPGIAIAWPKLDIAIMVSEKDQKHGTLAKMPLEFLPI
jgi:dTDP-4-dehydrorhamnose 3,5-epimerase